MELWKAAEVVYHDDTHHPVPVVMYSLHSYIKMGDVKDPIRSRHKEEVSERGKV